MGVSRQGVHGHGRSRERRCRRGYECLSHCLVRPPPAPLHARQGHDCFIHDHGQTMIITISYYDKLQQPAIRRRRCSESSAAPLTVSYNKNALGRPILAYNLFAMGSMGPTDFQSGTLKLGRRIRHLVLCQRRHPEHRLSHSPDTIGIQASCGCCDQGAGHSDTVYGTGKWPYSLMA